MIDLRITRIVWLGHQISKARNWIFYHDSSSSFSVSDYARQLPARAVKQDLLSPLFPPKVSASQPRPVDLEAPRYKGQITHRTWHAKIQR